MPGTDLLNRLIEYVPSWIAWPMSVLSTLSALGGAALIFYAAVYGETTHAIWAGVVFGASAVLWYVSDFAASNR